MTPAERQLCVKAAEGRLLDLRSGRAADDAPTGGGRWGSERQVRAQVLVQLLTGQGPQLTASATVGAVRLRGAAIAGDLDLGGVTLRCPLELNDCYMGDRLDLAKAEAPDISLHGSHLQQGLSACRLQLNTTSTSLAAFTALVRRTWSLPTSKAIWTAQGRRLPIRMVRRWPPMD